MNFPKKLLYTKNRVWVRVEDDTAVVGIIDELQDALESIETVQLPNVNDELEMDTECAVLHYNNSLYDIRSPLTGRVIAVNRDLRRQPELLHSDPYGDGWMFKMEYDEPDELEMLYTGSQFVHEMENGTLDDLG